MRTILLHILLISSVFAFGQEFDVEFLGDSGLSNFDIVDIDADGDLDVVSVESNFNDEKALIALINDGADDPTFTQVTLDDRNFRGDAITLDFDSDGDIDIITSLYDGTVTSAVLLSNQGDMTFATTDLTISDAFNYRVADMDGDGDFDIVSANRFGTTTINYHQNDGGTFGTILVEAHDDFINDFDIIDLNDDGMVEIILLSDSFSAPYLFSYTQDGSGNFTESEMSNTGELKRPEAIEIADYNTDGSLDIISLDEDRVVLLTNDGSGMFTPETLFAEFGDMSDLGLVDINGDDKLDVVIGDSDNGNHVFLQEDGNTVSAPIEVGGPRPARTITGADMDADGDMDIAYSNGDFAIAFNNVEQTISSTFDDRNLYDSLQLRISLNKKKSESNVALTLLLLAFRCLKFVSILRSFSEGVQHQTNIII